MASSSGLRILYRDELKGFSTSNVMMFLWIGLPLIGVTAYFMVHPGKDSLPMTIMSTSFISSLGGWIAAMMLAVQIINEMSRHVYDLFLIRPVRRRDIVLAKFLAVFTCVAIACLLSLVISIAADFLIVNKSAMIVPDEVVTSFVAALSIIAIECAAGALIGMVTSSVVAGVILVAVTHNIATMAVLMPLMSRMPHLLLLMPGMGLALSGAFLSLAIVVFNKKQF